MMDRLGPMTKDPDEWVLGGKPYRPDQMPQPEDLGSDLELQVRGMLLEIAQAPSYVGVTRHCWGYSSLGQGCGDFAFDLWLNGHWAACLAFSYGSGSNDRRWTVYHHDHPAVWCPSRGASTLFQAVAFVSDWWAHQARMVLSRVRHLPEFDLNGVTAIILGTEVETDAEAIGL